MEYAWEQLSWGLLLYSQGSYDRQSGSVVHGSNLGGIYSMLSLNLLPQRSRSKPQAEWLLHKRSATP